MYIDCGVIDAGCEDLTVRRSADEFDRVLEQDMPCEPPPIQSYQPANRSQPWRAEASVLG